VQNWEERPVSPHVGHIKFRVDENSKMRIESLSYGLKKILKTVVNEKQ
jgi:hypothetical protein